MNNYEGLLREIREKGIEINSIDDLININKEYKDILPILIKYLSEYDDQNDKEWLVRCLGVKGFTEATETLIREFYKASNNSELKWAIGNTMSLILDKNSINPMLKIVQEKEHGVSREMFVIALGKLKDKKVIPVLLKLINDPDVTGHVIMALSNFNDLNLVNHIKPFKNHKKTWIKKEAEKAIKKIDKRIK